MEAEQTQLSSGITPDSLDAKLREKLEASHVDIADLSGASQIMHMHASDKIL